MPGARSDMQADISPAEIKIVGIPFRMLHVMFQTKFHRAAA